MILGVDIGGTKIAVGRLSDAHNAPQPLVLSSILTAPTPAHNGPEAIVETVEALIAQLRGTAELTAVGVGTAGVVNTDGSIFSATNAITGWAGFPLSAALSFRLGVPVTVLNDVHAAAIGEQRFGAAIGKADVLMVAVGTGVGGALLMNGQLVLGRTGTAGSIGHTDIAGLRHTDEPRPSSGRDDISRFGAAEVAYSAYEIPRVCSCGIVGHLEPFALGPGIERSYRESTGRVSTLREIARDAASGDAMAIRTIADGARLLGRCLASASALLDIETIVIAGGVAQIGSSYLATVERAFRSATLPGPSTLEFRATTLGVTATIAGAATAVKLPR